MEEKERRLKIKKIEEYEEFCSIEKNNIVVERLMLGSFAIFGVTIVALLPVDIDGISNDFKTIFNMASTVAIVAGSLNWLKKLMESIGRKTLFEKEILDLTMDLEFDEKEEEKDQGVKQ